MDVLSAIGLAGNIIAFIDFGFQILTAAKDVYSSRTGSIRANDDIATITQEMKNLTIRLEVKKPLIMMTDEEKSLNRLVIACLRWSDELLALLDSLKSKDGKSKRQTLCVAWRNIRKQEEKDRLEKNLENCRQQLTIQLGEIARSDFKEDLNKILITNNLTKVELADLRENIDMIRSSSLESHHIDEETLGYTGTILSQLYKVLLENRKHKFDQALQFTAMNERFYDIPMAHSETLEWLVEKPQNVQTEDRKKAQTRASFTEWLRSGQGIFHISGKPGAGKSTLMKFLCHPWKTSNYLKSWAGCKQLLVAKVFFWRHGNELQKNLCGMLRSILSQLISQNSDLKHIAFGTQWNSLGLDSELHIGPVEIESGLEAIMCSDILRERHKIFLWVDALDEFTERHTGMEHSHIIQKFFGWTSKNPDSVKMCVSSRDWNVFVVGFAKCPKLRIHEYTHDDIIKFIGDSLAPSEYLVSPLSAQDKIDLCSEIADRAEGVFLWVRLVLAVVQRGLLNGDGMSDLKRKLRSFPTELMELYQHLFDSIDRLDRQKAYEALRMVQLNDCTIGLPLLRFKFLDELADDADLGFNLPRLYTSPDALEHDKILAHRQINGRCKGFLEVRERPGRLYPEDGEVRYMHSTVKEFLTQKHIKDAIVIIASDELIFDRLCQTFLADLKTVYRQGLLHGFCEDEETIREARHYPFPEQLDGLIGMALRHSILNGSVAGTSTVGGRFLRFLADLDETTQSRPDSRKEYPQLAFRPKYGLAMKDNQKNVLKRSSPMPMTFGSLVSCIAAGKLLHEFFAGKQYGNLHRAVSSPKDASNILSFVLSGIFPPANEPCDHMRALKMLGACFEVGISPNTLIHYDSGICFFDRLLIFLAHETGDWCFQQNSQITLCKPVELVELCLRFGAVSHLRIIFSPVQGRPGGNRAMAVQFGPLGSVAATLYLLWVRRDAAVVAFAEKHHWSLCLRDLVEFWFPNNYVALRDMIDANEERDCAGYGVGELGHNVAEVDISTNLANVEVLQDEDEVSKFLFPSAIRIDHAADQDRSNAGAEELESLEKYRGHMAVIVDREEERQVVRTCDSTLDVEYSDGTWTVAS